MIAEPDLAKKEWTERDLQALPHDQFRYELVGGELIMSPKNNFEHELICGRLFFALEEFNRLHKLGAVLGSSAGFWMRNKNCRAPDVSFVSKARLAEAGFKPSTRAFFPGAPDLAAEIISPGNTPAEINERLKDFFSSGCQLAWLIHPPEQFVQICHRPIDRTLAGPGASLSCEDLLPGFTFPIANLFTSDWDS